MSTEKEKRKGKREKKIADGFYFRHRSRNKYARQQLHQSPSAIALQINNENAHSAACQPSDLFR